MSFEVYNVATNETLGDCFSFATALRLVDALNARDNVITWAVRKA